LKKYLLGDREVWISRHQKLGYFIYDESNQLNVRSDSVRAYLLDEERTAIFLKELVRKKLLKIGKEEEKALARKLEKYEEIFVNKRVTHCYKCKRNLDSVNFSICEKCKWIKCQCAACGCGFKKMS
tara:strand:- start:84 stop:461 length:378 start_codon:yes stop_codon:yes gene_type:complete